MGSDLIVSEYMSVTELMRDLMGHREKGHLSVGDATSKFFMVYLQKCVKNIFVLHSRKSASKIPTTFYIALLIC